jgi:cell wall-associated NlpC family hydrolase
MALRKLFPRTLIAWFALGVLSTAAFGQTRPRTTTPVDPNEVSCSPDDPALINTAGEEVAKAKDSKESKPVWETKPTKPTIDIAPGIGSATPGIFRLQPLLLSAIDERLGSPYRWGATGPNAFDCSGFVWSIYQSIGIDFERGSARTLFSRFTPPEPEDQYKFGTLVFFSGLSHVGVVADEHGFYHASRRQGIIYSPFNEYWLKRIDGFRRVPLPAGKVTD